MAVSVPQPRTIAELLELTEMQNTEEYFPNGLKVSESGNPLYFPVEYTYQVGSAEILALCSNTVAVGTGQTGAAPLYVFCTDGIYALFVDSSGEMAYTNARIIARDVLSQTNRKSVTPIDSGVVFITQRGIMIISGEQVIEVGQPAEGDYLNVTDTSATGYMKIVKNAFSLKKIADFGTSIAVDTDFLSYINLDGTIVNYNHNERELMVSNPSKNYTYVLDRNQQWTRRAFSASEYLNNFPTSYRICNGDFYKVDVEQDGRDEQDNNFMALSQVIKLNSIGFKEGYRFVVRGDFETPSRRFITAAAKSGTDNIGNIPVVEVVYNSATGISKLQSGKSMNNMRGRTFEFVCTNNGDNTIKMCFGVKRGADGDIYVQDFFTPEIASGETVTYQFTIPSSGRYLTAGVIAVYSGSDDPIGDYDVEYTLEEVLDDPILGCYVFGSYDGRKWSMLGGNEKSGHFSDIGCLVERTDVRFFRFCLIGQLTGQSRLDYFEMNASGSKLLSKKTR